MSKRAVVSLLILLMICNMSMIHIEACAEPKVYNIDSESIKDIADRALKASKASGIQYAVMQNNQVLLSDSAGVSDKNSEQMITNETMFGIGSVSKMFVTAAVLKLKDKGKIDLDKPVTAYIDDFKMADERYKKITVRMLLNYSSGIMGTEYRDSFLFDDKDTEGYDNLLKELQTQRLSFEPGEFSVYCNDGFSLAQLLVERVSGKDFTSYINENFSRPLKMNNTKTILDDFDSEKLARTYDNKNEQMPQDSINIIGADGIYSTAEDLCRFMQMLNDNSLFSSTLSRKSIEALNTNEAEKGINPEENEGCMQYGLGWDSVEAFDLNRYNIKACVKGGDTFLYHAGIINIPEYKLSVAVLSSGGTSACDELMGVSILKNILQQNGIIKETLDDKKLTPLEEAPMPAELTEYSGVYMNRDSMINVDITADGKMKIYSEGQTEDKADIYTYTSDGYFINEKNNLECQPVREKNGLVYMKVKFYEGIEGIGQRAMDYYQMQKVDENKLTHNIKKAWDARKNAKYLLINEKYTSQLYKYWEAVHRLEYNDYTYGYADMCRIIDENNAQSDLQIPGTGSRDVSDLHFYIKDDKEYQKRGSCLYINAKDADELKSSISKVKIDDDGYAKWFKVSSLDKKQMTVSVPSNGAFAVYDKENKCLDYSLLSQKKTIDLKDGYYVAFMGDKEAEFDLSFK